MKTIGMLGGMSWESSIEYYRIINRSVKQRLGGLHSAECIMYSVDFAEIEVLQQQDRWNEAARILIQAASNIERGGADVLIICTNTMHKLAPEIQSGIHIPLLHIADATAHAIKAMNIQTVALLGTRYTMEEDFYKGRLTRQYGLNVMVPVDDDMDLIHRVIFDELCLGKILPESRDRYMAIIDRLEAAGAEGVILGCTEIGLLIKPDNCTVPLFDTTRIHAEAAVDFALAD